MGIGGRTRVGGDIPARLDDTVQSRAIYREVLDDGESPGTPRLDLDRRAISEGTHVQLAGCGCGTSVGDAVDHDTAHAADALTAVMVEGNRLLVRICELLVEHVQHLEEGHVRRHVVDVVVNHRPLGLGAGLTPNTQLEFHL